jgi:hypothetical protein
MARSRKKQAAVAAPIYTDSKITGLRIGMKVVKLLLLHGRLVGCYTPPRNERSQGWLALCAAVLDVS